MGNPQDMRAGNIAVLKHFKTLFITSSIAFVAATSTPSLAQERTNSEETPIFFEKNGCSVDAPKDSTDIERAAWYEICVNGYVNVYDLSNTGDYDGSCYNRPLQEKLTGKEEIDPIFWTTILTQPKYVNARVRPNVEISCAYISYLDLSHHEIQGSLTINNSVLEYVDLTSAQISGSLKFEQSIFYGIVRAQSLRVGQALSFWRSETLESDEYGYETNINLRDAQIGTYLSFRRANIRGELELERIDVAKSLFLDGNSENTAEFSKIDLQDAKIGNDLDFSHANFSETLHLGSINVGGDVRFGSYSSFKDINMWDANIKLNVFGINSTFAKDFNAYRVKVGGAILFRESEFGNFDLSQSQIGGSLDFGKATIEGLLNLHNSHITHSVVLDGGNYYSANFSNASIGNDFNFSNSIFSDPILVSSVNLNLERSKDDNEAKDKQLVGLELNSASIGGTLYANNTIFHSDLEAPAMDVKVNILLRGGSSFRAINMNAVHIGQSLEVMASNVYKDLQIQNASIGDNAFIVENSEIKNLDLAASTIGSHLLLEGTKFSGITDLTAVTADTLSLWRSRNRYKKPTLADSSWTKDAKFILRNTHVKTLQARMPNSWRLETGEHVPIDLQGFKYNNLGGLGSFDANYDLAQIKPEELIKWVKHSVKSSETINAYSPQPFRALENTLRSMGAENIANQVAYERLLHRAETRPASFLGAIAWIWDQILRVTIGFGVYPWYAVFWFAGMVGLGTLLADDNKQLCYSEDNKSNIERVAICDSNGESIDHDDATQKTIHKVRWPDRFFYSLENAVPLMEPSSIYGSVYHENRYKRWFFHTQKVVGFFLATVLIGAITLGL